MKRVGVAQTAVEQLEKLLRGVPEDIAIPARGAVEAACGSCLQTSLSSLEVRPKGPVAAISGG